MNLYPIPMVPGPTSVPQIVLDAMNRDYPSADLEREFLDLYNQTENLLRVVYETKNRVVIHTGEGMIALWGALKSTLLPGDRVLALASGVFGYGIAEMAASIGADVKVYGVAYNQTFQDWDAIERLIKTFRPKMITAVHCETPSGTLNPLEKIGLLKQQYEVPLFYVDAVASLGGTPVKTDEWAIDLCLGGSQKVFSAPPLAAFVTVSEAAWKIIKQVGYVGYDALLPFWDAQEKFYFPYTPNWHGVAAVHQALRLILDEGLAEVFKRHEMVADYCRKELQEMGLRLFPAENAVPSPTVTAVHIPEKFSWEELDRRFREMGLVVGGSYGPLAGKIFRLGHMGSQANMTLMEEALRVIDKVVNFS
ncbi:serine-pyruvate aminotransferase [Bellilinea caldifistulae]|uniref:Aminotransferase n=1 Tax=Bellilinea caldifistulae TaxID=360411 RepID=A0A0P6WX68_9CHLR|nr:alanine--glyoxylate aminotransferase family protein [Bellilinea caldifistulae]KPL70828.1 aminotransferase [Bellilinea caldifistulae]GAP10954.1 serine-pyruvate aminotransferase [Bellilinea caldifistulae]